MKFMTPKNVTRKDRLADGRQKNAHNDPIAQLVKSIREPTETNNHPKCQGCEHFMRNRGSTGLCEVGAYPQNCGDGSSPALGYSPLGGFNNQNTQLPSAD